jgi:hypothetical protein
VLFRSASIKEAVSEEMEIGEEDEMPEGVDGGAPIQIELMDMLKEFIKKISEKMSDMEEKVEEVESQFKAFKSQPAGKKISDGKTDFNKEISNADSAEEKIAAIMAMRESNKK